MGKCLFLGNKGHKAVLTNNSFQKSKDEGRDSISAYLGGINDKIAF